MKSKTGDFKFSLFCFFASVLTIGFFAACEQTTKLNDMKPYKGPVIKTFDLTTIYSDSAEVRIKMQAPLQLEYADGNQDFPKGILINFYNKERKNHARLTAKKGKFIKQKNLYVAYGDVIVKSLLKKEQLNTEELNWTPNDQKIFTDKFVTITTDKEILLGNGLTAKQDFTDYQISKPTGEFTIKK